MLSSVKYQNKMHYCCFAEDTGPEFDIIPLNGKDPTATVCWVGDSSLNNNCQHCPIITLSLALICSCPYLSKPLLCSQLCVGSQMSIS